MGYYSSTRNVVDVTGDSTTAAYQYHTAVSCRLNVGFTFTDNRLSYEIVNVAGLHLSL